MYTVHVLLLHVGIPRVPLSRDRVLYLQSPVAVGRHRGREGKGEFPCVVVTCAFGTQVDYSTRHVTSAMEEFLPVLTCSTNMYFRLAGRSKICA